MWILFSYLFFSFSEDGLSARLETLSLSQLKDHPKLIEYFSQSRRFQRGEVQNVNLQKDLLDRLEKQLEEPFNKANLHSWLTFAADLSYEEGTVEAMHFCHQIRLKIMEHLERNHSLLNTTKYNLKTWLAQWPMPWPVDRIILHQARLNLSSIAESQLQRLIAEIKKNPYQSIESCAARLFGAKGALSFVPIKSVWTENEVQMMKKEVLLYQKLLLWKK